MYSRLYFERRRNNENDNTQSEDQIESSSSNSINICFHKTTQSMLIKVFCNNSKPKSINTQKYRQGNSIKFKHGRGKEIKNIANKQRTYFFLATLPVAVGFLVVAFLVDFLAVAFFAGAFLAGVASFLVPNFGFGPLAMISRHSSKVKSLASLPHLGIL